ncbi:MAG: DUF4159 domain-containing protein [Chloroherpetonaceae bacterium]|nr:DUF4159 domain-containing protein [Chloroherpetonaceae bacterium]
MPLFAQANLPPAFRCARLKYSGGGDWYNDPSAVPNLMKYIREKVGILAPLKEEVVEASSPAIFQYSFVFMTGHGNVRFTDAELDNIRNYLKSGGFIYADDDYGMDKSFRREVKRIFPGTDLVELPYSHPIFHHYYKFPNGAPKIHEHDNKPPQTFGLFYNGRLVLLYTYESNPSDGWANPDVHNDPPEKREEALKFGVNVVLYAISN